MSKEILQDIIDNFNPDKFSDFFRNKNRNFSRFNKSLSQYNDDKFIECTKIGEINFESDNTFFVLIKSKNDLTEKAIKKLQYEKAKKILKDQQADSGIFVFYDKIGSFRFSLVYADYIGKREWSSFKRFTYFVKKGITNKTFLRQIGDLSFDSLKNIKEAFSVDKVTKDFYRDIANWYFWAVDNCKFPVDAETVENGRNIAVIRLITRMIFIWFMKELRLIPDYLFQKKFAGDILKDISDGESSYYKAVLQNLFFATLSTPKEQREFADEIKHAKGHNDDFGNQSVFRYHELFKSPVELKTYFADIPYLNGGLFECLDNGKESLYVDGFTRRKQFQPVFPNCLFFSKEHNEDLNKWYGTNDKRYKVKGLLEILLSYNFTVDENTNDDADVALDPELLGKVFENLLASFNPETSTTARKVTGSFYTPREIVDYMVTKSIKEYLKTHLNFAHNLDEKLDKLFDTLQKDNPFEECPGETEKLVDLIENIKIVDPAVGSGAFPMGVLNKLVFILNKIDRGNKLWKEAQLKSVENIQDSRLREETINHINNYFENKNPDYGRKLYLIQKCIYGVDIQQIAVEISKLRFFISLLIDEKIDQAKPNWNIEPLPNLDFKIMQGNSLLEEYEGITLFDESLFDDVGFDKINSLNILKRKQVALQREILELNKLGKYTQGVKKDYAKKLEEVSKNIESLVYSKKTTDSVLDMFDIHLETIQKRDELTKLHREYFEVSDKLKKSRIRKNIEKLEWELIESTLIAKGQQNKLKELDVIRKSNTKPFFLWKLHFPEVTVNGGFDIVIGNPPYLDSESMTRNYLDFRNRLKNKYSTARGNWDLFVVFVERGLMLTRNEGCFAYIIPNKLISAKYTFDLRRYLSSKTVIEIIDYSNVDVFEEADVYPVVLIVKNSEYKQNKIRTRIMSNFNTIKVSNYVEPSSFYKDIFWDKYFFRNELLNLIINITGNDLLIDHFPNIVGAATVSEAYEIKNIISEHSNQRNYFKFINTGTIDPFLSLWGKKSTQYIKSKYNRPIIDMRDLRSLSKSRYEQSSLPKIIVAGMSLRIEALYDEGEYCAGKSTSIILGDKKQLKTLLGILNSKLITFWFFKYFNSLTMAGGYLNVGVNEIGMIPLVKNYYDYADQISKLVEYITISKSTNMKTDFYELILDCVVYEMYFEDLMHSYKCGIIKYLDEVPEIDDRLTISNKQLIIEDVYSDISKINHKINKTLLTIKNIDEIKLLENNI